MRSPTSFNEYRIFVYEEGANDPYQGWSINELNHYKVWAEMSVGVCQVSAWGARSILKLWILWSYCVFIADKINKHIASWISWSIISMLRKYFQEDILFFFFLTNLKVKLDIFLRRINYPLYFLSWFVWEGCIIFYRLIIYPIV